MTHDDSKSKVFTLRHFLFYMGVAAVLGTAIGVAHNLLNWSDGLTFAVAAISGTIASTFAVREDLFAPASASHGRRNHRVS